MKIPWKYILPVAAGLVILTLIELATPKPLNWQETYSKEDKIPYGSFVLREMLPDIFPGQTLYDSELSIYETLGDSTDIQSNYIFIQNTFAPDESDLNALLRFAAKGNSIFIAAETFSPELRDTLRFENSREVLVLRDTIEANFSNSALRDPKNFTFRQPYSIYFSEFDTLRSTVLGTDGKSRVNFLKITFGEGSIFISLVPRAFTNYAMLDRKNVHYTARALSYLDRRQTIWDEYYKGINREPQTPLRYILSRDALRWAYFLTLGGVLLFFIFEARRRQRIIPVIKPLANSTVEFTETVGRLYYQHGNHKNLAEKKILYFFDYIRNRFHEKEIVPGEEFYRKLAAKSGLEFEEVRDLFGAVERVGKQDALSQKELLDLDHKMEQFKTKAG